MKSKTTKKTKSETVTKPRQMKQIDPLKLSDVPGIGPAAEKALNGENIFTTFDLIHKTPTWLKDVGGLDKDKAAHAFAFCKKNLEAAGLVTKQQMTGTEAVEAREHVQRIKSNCKALDHIFDGGLECGAVTEIFGEDGSGKTETALQFCIQVQLPKEEGGLAEEGKPAPLVMYIDTENIFRGERIISMLAGRKLITSVPQEIMTKVAEGKPLTEEQSELYKQLTVAQKNEAKKYLDHIIRYRISDAVGQNTLIDQAISIVKQIPIKLIVVDSGTALFRSEYLGRGNIKTKFDLMNEMIHQLKAIAELNKVAVLFLNQIYNSPTTDDRMGQHPDIPYGGNIIGHAVPYRIRLERSGQKHRATIVKSPYQGNDSVRFDITMAGLVDIEAKKEEA